MPNIRGRSVAAASESNGLLSRSGRDVGTAAHRLGQLLTGTSVDSGSSVINNQLTSGPTIEDAVSVAASQMLDDNLAIHRYSAARSRCVFPTATT
jgi:hypothetical protein